MIDNPMPGNQLENVYFDENYENGAIRRERWYPGMTGAPNAITSEVTEPYSYAPEKTYHHPKYITIKSEHSWMDCTETAHKPMLDIDFPAKLIPSSTEGHFHLYLDKEMPWSTYVKLLQALAEAGIVEEGYARASIARGYTCLRLPGVTKGDDELTRQLGDE